jgi:hypothetical protein
MSIRLFRRFSTHSVCAASLCAALSVLGSCKTDAAKPAPGSDAGGVSDASKQRDAASIADGAPDSDAGVAAHVPTATQLMSGGDCPPPSGAGTVHADNITADEAWTAAASPHHIDSDIRISATVKVEACAVVVLGKGVTLQVGGSTAQEAGTLQTRGLFSAGTGSSPDVVKPVVFRSAADDQHWNSLRVQPNGKADLELTLLANGGDPSAAQNGGGALLAVGNNDGTLTKNLRASKLYILGSGGYGVNLTVGSGFTDDSSDVVVRQCGGSAAPEPVSVDVPGVGTLPSGLYDQNMKDEIVVNTRLQVNGDEVFHALHVPYRVEGALYLRPKTPATIATLTLEPSVVLKLTDRIIIGDGGSSMPYRASLIAQGTKDEPIVFTSAKATPAPGDWTGLIFEGMTTTGSALEYATIEYAGGSSQTSSYGCGPKNNDAAVIILNERPSTSFITHSTFRHNAGESTIVSGWVADASGPNLVQTNTFADTGGSSGTGCLQSLWRSTAANYCPSGTGPFCAP